MKETYMTDVYSSPDSTEIIDILCAGLDYVDQYTDATVQILTRSSGTLIALILEGDRCFKINMSFGESTLTLSRGYLENGEFVSTYDLSKDRINPHDPFEDASYYCRFTVVNNGAFWDLHYCFHRFSGSVGYGYVNMHIMSACLKSSIDEHKIWTGRVFEGDSISYPFPNSGVGGGPYNDMVVHNKYDYMVYHTRLANAVNNIESGKMLLFPSLLSVGVPNGLGVATIDGELPYYMGFVLPMNMYTEFYVDRVKYISLGNIAIRSL